MERLKEYRRKRDFTSTAEPTGGAVPDAGASRFVVHKHVARRLHYDLRLEDDGVLRSWALPKGPSLVVGERRLAVEVEDHPLEYADFEGTIPAGEYGGGTVMLWDRGRWRRTSPSGRSDRIDLELDGVKLRGAWTLARTRARQRDESDWLMIKRRDAHPPLAPDDRSVLTGRTMDEIASGAPRQTILGGDDERRDAADLVAHGARGGAMPVDVDLQLARLRDAAPDGDAWLHEIKFDGYRIIARIEDGVATLRTRNAHDWTARAPEIVAALRGIGASHALLDGEVVVFGERGVSSFGALQEALRTDDTARLRYQVFDLLHLDGFDLRSVPLARRKEALARLLTTSSGEIVRYTEHVQGQGPAFFAHACELGLEGIISKAREAPYRSGRSDRWRKVKCTCRDAFVVGGFTPPSGSRSAFGSLLLGTASDDGEITYAGRVGSGFGDRQLAHLHERLLELERPTSPFVEPVPDARGATWVEPVLVVEVGYTETTRDGRLRHPVFHGLLESLRPSPVDRTVAAARGEGHGATRKPARGSRRAGETAEVAGVRLTNANRVLYPEQGVTKLAVAEYYERVQEYVLPGMVGRPLALVRCPQGHEEGCFYQKHPGDAFAKGLPRVAIEEGGDRREYAYVASLADIIALVQVGVLEVHVWGSRIEDVEHPDLMVIDLDPGPDVAWSLVRSTALELRERLADLDLDAFLRTTGGKGLHLVVPLLPEHDWNVVKTFARGFCERAAAEHPEHLVTTASKAKREGRIYLDYLRNGRGATAIASYSTRARPGAPVAVPVRWDELGESLRPDRYDVGNVARRLAALRADPWVGFAEAARAISPSALDAVAKPAKRR